MKEKTGSNINVRRAKSFRRMLTFNLMSSKMMLTISLALCMCSCAKRDPGSDFAESAFALRYAQDYWVSHGRPRGFQLSEIIGPPGTFFVFTNMVNTTNGALHCRFGARWPGWPPGVLAITDEKLLIFIRERDGKVIFSPEINGVEY